MSFFASAQDVVIPADVARYFLEESDRVKILKKKDSINKETVFVLNEELVIKQHIIDSYKSDSLLFRSIIKTKNKEDSTIKVQLMELQRLVNIKNFNIDLLSGVSVGAIIGSAIPGVGTLTGSVCGAVAGTVVYGLKKVRKLLKQ